MNRIINNKEIEQGTAIVECGSTTGTAFCVANEDGEILLLTAYHNIEHAGDGKIEVHFNKEGELESYEVSIVESLPDKDVAILRTNSPVTDLPSLPLVGMKMAYDATWEAFGYPAVKKTDGARINGTIARTNEGSKWDTDLNCDQYASLSSFKGMSGSALIMEGRATGVIGFDLDGSLGATSIAMIEDLLDRHKIIYQSPESEDSTPESIKEDAEDTVANDDILEKMESVMTEVSSKFYLLSGSPGSGKTTLCAQFEFESKKHIVIDKFFVKVPDKEEVPTHIRATPIFFREWVEALYFRILFGTAPSKTEKSLNEKLLEIRQGLQALGKYYTSIGKRAYILVDGIDDVNPAQMDDFLSVFLGLEDSGCSILFSCTSSTILSAKFRSEINATNEIKVLPLDLEKAEAFFRETLEEKDIPATQIQELAIKSEGHPLYMRYLSQYVLGLENINSISGWLQTIPLIGGQIEVYYNNVWSKFTENKDEIWIASMIARLRQGVDKETLFEMLPAESKTAFPVAFPKIEHLLRDKNQVSIYHTSFADYIKEHTQELTQSVHKRFADYALEHKETFFSISERIYHLSKSGSNTFQLAINECTQEWTDVCANKSVLPDQVLADIKSVIKISADLGISNEVIRLLLLSQRISYRYNVLFKENAFYLVDALLALGKPVEAIRYIIRNGAITVSDGEALYFLQKFYDYGANEQAEEIMRVIRRMCTEMVESGKMNTKVFNRFIGLRLNSTTLYTNTSFEKAHNEYYHFKDLAMKVIKGDERNTQEVQRAFLDQYGSYNAGYLVWRFKIPPFTKLTEEKFPKSFNQYSSGFIAHTILHSSQFRLNMNNREPIAKLDEWVADLEYVIEKYGTSAEYDEQLVSVLIEDSKRTDLIIPIATRYTANRPELTLRTQNGVDANHESIGHFTMYAQAKGYIDEQLANFDLLYEHNWESGTKAILEFVWGLMGRMQRLKVEGDSATMDSYKPAIDKLLQCLKFTLNARSRWDRAYGIPEKVFSVIYVKLTQLLVDFFPDKVFTLVDHVCKQEQYQLGLYNEGYIESLFSILRTLFVIPEQSVNAFSIAKILENQIQHYVLNRMERNSYLLRLAERYAFMGSTERANLVFENMIQTSMGPSWYKEAQLGIINTAVTNILPVTGTTKYLQQFAGHLDAASGEMTFQRYVKHAQEEFMGDIAKNRMLDKAIELFKFYTLPDYTIIIDQAESGKVDMIARGNGYILGAREINEQSGISNILQNIDCEDSEVAWGLAELFVIGDDRYIYGYAKIFGKILNAAELTSLEKRDRFCKRLARLAIAETEDEYRYTLLGDVFKELTDSNVEKVQAFLKDAGMQPSEKPKKEDGDEPKLEKTERETVLDRLDDFGTEAKRFLMLENKATARQKIIAGMDNAREQEYDIWSTNYSSHLTNLVNMLADSYQHSAELLRDIARFIVEDGYTEYWQIADRIIELLRNIQDEDEKQRILNEVQQHLYLMVKTPTESIEKYKWIDSSAVQEYDQETRLFQFLVWFLNHPVKVVKSRAMEILAWIAEHNPKLALPLLMDEILSDGPSLSKELSAAVIHQASATGENEVWEYLSAILETMEKEVLAIKHFMIRVSLIDALKEFKNAGIDTGEWIEKLSAAFASNNKKSGEILIEDKRVEPFSDFFYYVNEYRLLDKNYPNELFGLLDKHITLPYDQCKHAEHYIDRSFNNHNQVSIVSDLENKVRFAINESITSRVPKSKIEDIALLLRFYQPTFPERKLVLSIDDRKEINATIKAVSEQKSVDIEPLLAGDNYWIHFMNKERKASSTESSDKYEITAYLIPKKDFDGKRPRFSMPGFSYNGYEVDQSEEVDKGVKVIPLVMTGTFVDTAGFDLVPAVANFAVPAISSQLLLEMVDKKYWRIGRNWEQQYHGKAIKTGHSLSISKSIIDPLEKEYKLLWLVRSGYQHIWIDVFDKKIF